ncbi:MAG: hypothetical protein ACTSVV_04555 [Promethearchaeota archaeon]
MINKIFVKNKNMNNKLIIAILAIILMIQSTYSFFTIGNSIIINLNNSPPSQVKNLIAYTTGTNWIVCKWTNPNDPDLNHINIYLNNTFLNSTLKDYFIINNLLPNTSYMIKISTVDEYGNENLNSKEIKIKTKPEPDIYSPYCIKNLIADEISTNWTRIKWINPYDLDFNYTRIYLNDSNIINLSNNYLLLKNLTPNTVYKINITTVDRYNNQNTSSVGIIFRTVLVDTQSPNYYIDIVNKEIGSSWIYCALNMDMAPDFSHFELYLNDKFICNLTTNYFNLTNLKQNTRYVIELYAVDKFRNKNYTSFTIILRTEYIKYYDFNSNFLILIIIFIICLILTTFCLIYLKVSIKRIFNNIKIAFKQFIEKFINEPQSSKSHEIYFKNLNIFILILLSLSIFSILIQTIINFSIISLILLIFVFICILLLNKLLNINGKLLFFISCISTELFLGIYYIDYVINNYFLVLHYFILLNLIMLIAPYLIKLKVSKENLFNRNFTNKLFPFYIYIVIYLILLSTIYFTPYLLNFQILITIIFFIYFTIIPGYYISKLFFKKFNYNFSIYERTGFAFIFGFIYLTIISYFLYVSNFYENITSSILLLSLNLIFIFIISGISSWNNDKNIINKNADSNNFFSFFKVSIEKKFLIVFISSILLIIITSIFIFYGSLYEISGELYSFYARNIIDKTIPKYDFGLILISIISNNFLGYTYNTLWIYFKIIRTFIILINFFLMYILSHRLLLSNWHALASTTIFSSHFLNLYFLSGDEFNNFLSQCYLILFFIIIILAFKQIRSLNKIPTTTNNNSFILSKSNFNLFFKDNYLIFVLMMLVLNIIYISHRLILFLTIFLIIALLILFLLKEKSKSLTDKIIFRSLFIGCIIPILISLIIIFIGQIINLYGITDYIYRNYSIYWNITFLDELNFTYPGLLLISLWSILDFILIFIFSRKKLIKNPPLGIIFIYFLLFFTLSRYYWIQIYLLESRVVFHLPIFLGIFSILAITAFLNHFKFNKNVKKLLLILSLIFILVLNYIMIYFSMLLE